MANNFNIISRKFYNQLRNNLLFTDNLTEFTSILVGGSGEKIKLIEDIQLGTIVNESESIPLTFDTVSFDSPSSQGFLIGTIDFISEGLAVNDVFTLEWDGGAVGNTLANITIVAISGANNNKLFFSQADYNSLIALGLTAPTTKISFVIKKTSRPLSLNYFYGLVPNNSSAENYTSPLGAVEQGYNIQVMNNAPIFSTMDFIGGLNGYKYGTVKSTFVGTTQDYFHQYQIEHEFIIPYYKAGELPNIENSLPPANLISSNSLKYINRYEFGNNGSYNTIYVNLGQNGNVKYFDQPIDNYTIQDYEVINQLNTGKIEVTVSNSISFKIKKNNGNWLGTEDIIFYHTKLPTAAEYTNQADEYGNVWVYDNSRAAIGGAIPPQSSMQVIDQYEITLDVDTSIVTVTVDINFTTAQQNIIFDTSNYALFVTVAGTDISLPYQTDKVNKIVSVDSYTKNTDIAGLIDNHTLNFYPDYAANTSDNYSNFSGGDGDLWGCKVCFDMVRTLKPVINSAKFRIIARSATDSFELYVKEINIGQPQLVSLDFPPVVQYQILNLDYQNNLNLPSTDPLNRVKCDLNAVTRMPIENQRACFEFGFQTPWREWEENLNVNNIFYNTLQPNNNLNNKTSNYSNINNYDVYGVFEVEIGNSQQTNSTLYSIESDVSTVLEFDSATWVTSSIFRYYDESNDLTDNLFESENVKIEIDFVHALGLLPSEDLEGVIWIEQDQNSAPPSYLSTQRDWEAQDNKLQSLNTTGLVTILSTNNSVVLSCLTNRNNLTAGIQYNVYGKLWNRK
jgi:hypothetical protein